MRELIKTIIALAVSKLPKSILTDQRFFELYQSKGWHVVPVHFYRPIPNTAELTDTLWEKPSEMIGIETNLQFQSGLLQEIAESYLKEYHKIPNETPKSATEYSRSTGFAGIDGAMLYSIIRKYKPKRIIEIGSGYSTLLSILALKKNKDENISNEGNIISIEPYPKDFLKESLNSTDQLIIEKVENVPLAIFETLEENDILFIDSSHTVKIGGDVIYEILEIVPRLKKGVLIQFHDIFLPLQYPKDWVMDYHRFWTEQYLLHAFLTYNNYFEILWSGGCMHVYKSEMLSRYFPDYDSNKQRPGSFWIRRCK